MRSLQNVLMLKDNFLFVNVGCFALFIKYIVILDWWLDAFECNLTP